ncbi:MAG TPA: acetyl-CoA carboxylase carboxyltransferase subunit alpha [Pyrinomonadaceae bacterium]|nr:acetyl-CoA carboxylase carboxyltransferase subunit alpha [Pyrinomonadaceae bacterium]
METLGEREEGAYSRVQEARNPKRPYTNDLLEAVFDDFVEIHGDRRFADDPAMVCGFAKLGRFEVAVAGQQKGRDMNQRRFRNFAMPKPEGYRKALRLMKLAEKFGRPVITFVDTPGAYPGIDAEERGQAEAIAFNLREMASLRVPVIVVVLGEGGSGGALAIGVGDRVLMLENAVYSVITPEGCAAILWKDAAKAPAAAAGLRLTADDLKKLGIIDGVIREDFGDGSWVMPDEGSASDDERFAALREILTKELSELTQTDPEQLLKKRYEKFRAMGRWVE